MLKTLQGTKGQFSEIGQFRENSDSTIVHK